MKRVLLSTLAWLLISAALAGCGTTAPEPAPSESETASASTAVSSSDSSTAPEMLYQADPAIDLFVCQGVSCVNAADVDWVTGMELEPGELLGTIARTGVTAGFQDWDATVLPEGCEIFSTGRDDILLAASGGTLCPYLKWVEG